MFTFELQISIGTYVLVITFSQIWRQDEGEKVLFAKKNPIKWETLPQKSKESKRT